MMIGSPKSPCAELSFDEMDSNPVSRVMVKCDCNYLLFAYDDNFVNRQEKKVGTLKVYLSVDASHCAYLSTSLQLLHTIAALPPLREAA